jgi:ribonuclease R
MKNIEQQLLQLFSTFDSSIQLNDIAKTLKIKSESKEYEDLKKLLDQLVENGTLNKSSRRRYSRATNNVELYEGTFHIHKSSAFVELDSKLIVGKVAVKHHNYNGAFDGDKVQIRLKSQKKSSKVTGEITKVIARVEHKITGKIDVFNGQYFVIPNDKKYYLDFLVHNPNKNLIAGDKVDAIFHSWKDNKYYPEVLITKHYSALSSAKDLFDDIITEFKIQQEFPIEVIEEAKKFKSINKREFKNRLDLRDELIITIDPIDAKDFDDALSLTELENGNYKVGIHIADVSYYVVENSELDIEARDRGNSIYLVDRVIPMLPENLSNNLCSLKPNEDRLAFSVIAELNENGKVIKYEIKETVINSKRRYNYEEVVEILEAKSGDNLELLQSLNKLAKTLREKRFKEGGVNFETSEIRFQLDDNKYPTHAYEKKASDSTQLVEEFMLLANQIVAHHLLVMTKEQGTREKLPYLYRIHDKPEPDVIAEAIRYISDLSSKSLKNKDVTAKEINSIIESFKGTPEATIVSQMLIRSMPKAVYSQENFGHFGLGFKEYSHFTSPIRRYADLVVHRLIKEYTSTKIKQDRLQFLKVFCRSAAQHITQTERFALECERASIKLASILLAKDKIGEIYEGTISGVQSYGVFVLVNGIYAEGLLRARDLTDDYYSFDEKKQCFIGRHKKVVVKIGSKLKIQIKKVNLEKRQVDLVFLSHLN